MACVQVCLNHAIVIDHDELGNAYPKISESKCIHCGKCCRHCPEQLVLIDTIPQRAYACWSLDDNNRKTSASGGAASEFYAAALEDGYWICGAEYAGNGSVIHTLSRDMESIQRYKQSKYVFSDTSDVYTRIKDLLDQGSKAIMISLPCKIAGLLAFLGKTYDNLLTVDIVCHGTPPVKMLQNHILKAAGRKDNFTIKFREDNLFLLSVEAQGKTLYKKIGREDEYLAAFLNGLSYRDSCYQCKYAKPERISDITICDFWGLGAEIPFEHPYAGSISAVLLNTERGANFFQKCSTNLFAEERPVSEAIKGNAQLNAPTPAHPHRNAFVEGCAAHGFDTTVSELLKDEIKAACKNNRRNACRKALRKCTGIFIKRYRG
jgi:coenzyme F420-reducing hydrogenase beta subunit